MYLRLFVLGLLFLGVAGCDLFTRTKEEEAAGVDAPGPAALKEAGKELAKGLPGAAQQGPIGVGVLLFNTIAAGVNAFLFAHNRRTQMKLKAQEASSGP